MSRLLTSRLASWFLATLLVLQAAPVLAEPDVYFSPNGGIRDRLLRAINHTKASIDLAIFDFTSGELAAALVTAKDRGVMIRIVADARQAQGKHSEIPVLLEKGVKVRLVRGNGRGIMHHKFAIFDGRLLVTGSYNRTDSAERFNHENAIILDDPVVIGRYQVSFERLYNGPGAVSRIPSSYGSASFGPIIPETRDRQGHSWVQVFEGTSDRPCHTSVTLSYLLGMCYLLWTPREGPCLIASPWTRLLTASAPSSRPPSP